MMRSVSAGWVVLLLTSVCVSSLSAQTDRWLNVTEPGEWSRREAIRWQAGQPLRVAGNAGHPTGIVSVSVNGAPADLQDRGSGVVTFSYLLRVDENTREVRVVAYSASDTLPPQVFDVDLVQIQRVESGPAAAGVVQQPPGPQVPGFIPSVLIPGSGQFRTGRGGLGILVLGASVGVAAAGILTTQVEVSCATRTSTCEGANVLSSEESRPYLVPAIVGAVAISALGAWEARKTARAGFGAARGAAMPGRILAVVPRVANGKTGALELEWSVPF